VIDPRTHVRQLAIELPWRGGERVSNRGAGNRKAVKERIPAQTPAVLRGNRVREIVRGGFDRIEIVVAARSTNCIRSIARSRPVSSSRKEYAARLSFTRLSAMRRIGSMLLAPIDAAGHTAMDCRKCGRLNL